MSIKTKEYEVRQQIYLEQFKESMIFFVRRINFTLQFYQQINFSLIMSQWGRNRDPLYIDVETCINCHLHSWCSRHDQSKYQNYYEKLKAGIQKQFPNSVVNNNNRPVGLKLIEDESKQEGYRFVDDKGNQVGFPRLGAFEVYVNQILIYSKLKSCLWPSIDRILRIVHEISKSISQGKDPSNYSLQYRLQNSIDFQFIETYRVELKRNQSSYRNHKSYQKIDNSNKKNFKSRLLSNPKAQRQMIQSVNNSPIWNKKKLSSLNYSQQTPLTRSKILFKRQKSQNNEQLMKKNSNDIQFKRSQNEDDEQGLIHNSSPNASKKHPIAIRKAKFSNQRSIRNNNSNSNDEKRDLGQILQRKLLHNKNAQNKQESPKMNKQAKKEQKEKQSIQQIKGWSQKQRQSDFVLNSQTNQKKGEQLKHSKTPSINDKLDQQNYYTDQFIEDEDNNNRSSNKNQDKISNKNNDILKSLQSKGNTKSKQSSLQFQRVHSQIQQNYRSITKRYPKIVNWQANFMKKDKSSKQNQFVLQQIKQGSVHDLLNEQQQNYEQSFLNDQSFVQQLNQNPTQQQTTYNLSKMQNNKQKGQVKEEEHKVDNQKVQKIKMDFKNLQIINWWAQYKKGKYKLKNNNDKPDEQEQQLQQYIQQQQNHLQIIDIQEDNADQHKSQQVHLHKNQHKLVTQYNEIGQQIKWIAYFKNNQFELEHQNSIAQEEEQQQKQDKLLQKEEIRQVKISQNSKERQNKKLEIESKIQQTHKIESTDKTQSINNEKAQQKKNTEIELGENKQIQWIGSYKNSQFVIQNKKPENSASALPKEQTGVEKLKNKQEDNEIDIVNWMASFNNNQFILQQFEKEQI